MNYNQFLKDTNLKNIYTLCGDAFLADNCISNIKQKLEIINDYDITKFDADNFSCNALIESCEQMSFFAKKRLVIVKNLTSITVKDQTKLLSYIQNVNPLTTLIFLDTLNSGVFDFLKTEKVTLALNDYEIRDYIKQELANFNKTMANETINLLIDFCQKDMNRINLEINKLIAYIGERQEINLEDIKLLVPQTEELIVFELTTALGKKDAQKSLFLLSKLMGNVEQNSKLFALLSTQIRRMFFAAISKNLTDQEIANKLGVKEFAVKKLKEQCKNFSVSSLKNIVYELCEIDYNIKNGLMSLDNALYYLVEFITLN